MSKEDRQKDEKTVVRLRLTQTEIKDLKAAGEKHGRKLATEIAYRLRGGEASAPPTPFAAWPPAEAEIFEKFGEAVAHLLADVTSAAGSTTSLQDRLGFMRAALPVLLDELGASTPNGVHESYYEARTRDAIRGERWKGYAAANNLAVRETDLARLVRELKAPVDAAAKPASRKTKAK